MLRTFHYLKPKLLIKLDHFSKILLYFFYPFLTKSQDFFRFLRTKESFDIETGKVIYTASFFYFSLHLIMGITFFLNQVYQKIPGLKKYEEILIQFLKKHMEGKKSLVIDEEFLKEIKSYIKQHLKTQKKSQKLKEKKTSSLSTPNKQKVTPTPNQNTKKLSQNITTTNEKKSSINTPKKKNPKNNKKNLQKIIYKNKGRGKAFALGFLICFLLFALAFYYQFVFAPHQGLPHLNMEKILSNVWIPKAFAPTDR